MGLIKKLFKKYSVRFRKKDTSIIDNQLKDYGDFDIDIVYARDYLLKLDNMTIKPYIVFCIVIDISKEDIIRDYYDNFIPFITSIDTDYIVNTKDNKLYTYVGLNKFTILDIIDHLYPDGKDISYILSNMMTVFFGEMNTEPIFVDERFKYRNTVDKIPHTENFIMRSKNNVENNVLFMDKIPNINNAFTPYQLLSLGYIGISTGNYGIYYYNIIDILKYYTKSSKCVGINSVSLDTIKNDNYFNINIHGTSIHIFKYAQQNKTINKNIYRDYESIYDDIDEVVDDKSDYSEDYNPEFGNDDFDHSIYGSEDNKL